MAAMPHRSSLLLACVAVLAVAAAPSSPFAQAPAARVTAITGATLIDGTGGAPVADAVIVVTGDRITAAGPRASRREDSFTPFARI